MPETIGALLKINPFRGTRTKYLSRNKTVNFVGREQAPRSSGISPTMPELRGACSRPAIRASIHGIISGPVLRRHSTIESDVQIRKLLFQDSHSRFGYVASDEVQRLQRRSVLQFQEPHVSDL